MSYANAFNCKECPQSNGPQGCPVWWEMIEILPGGGGQQIKKDCGWRILPFMFVDAMKVQETATITMNELRNSGQKMENLFAEAIQLANNPIQTLTLEKPDA